MAHRPKLLNKIGIGSLGAYLACSASWAQTGASPDAGVSQSESQGSELMEIVVSAQRREERLLETPISIGVLTGADLDRGGTRGVADVLNQAGGVSLVETQPGEAQIALRGVVSDPNSGTPTAGFYLDEVPFAFVTTAQLPDASAYDLARVEVLRGPQGTLYGANALSGVVRILSNDPDLDDIELKGRIRGSETAQSSATNFGGDLALNVPLIPGRLAVRGVASYSKLRGYIDSTGEAFGVAPAEDINGSRNQNYRFKLRYQPIENLDVRLGVAHSRIDNGAPSQSADDLTTQLSADQSDRRVYDTFNLITEYAWSTVSLLSSTSYFDYSANSEQEILVAAVLPLHYYNHYGLNAFSQELRLSSNQPGAWRWSAGAIYKDARQNWLQDAAPLLPTPFAEKNRSRSYAVFGELTRAFDGGRFELTGGARYFDDRLVTTQLSSFSTGSEVIDPRRASFDKMTGRLVLAFKPSSQRTLYASVATGFRSGVNQTSAVAETNPEFPPVDPDSLINYELGFKGRSAEGRFAYDLAAYFIDWSDIQQGLITPFGFFVGVNAGDASGAGFDASFELRPTPSWLLHANLGWNGIEIDQDIFQPGDMNLQLFATGDRLNNSAEWTGSLGTSYSLPAPIADARVVLGGGYTYRSSLTLRYLNGASLTPTQSGALRTLKVHAGLETDGWSAELFADNLTNEKDAISPPDITYNLNAVRQRPRTIGVQATFRF